ncbi:MAG: hypothetical protein IJ003_03705 [Candidatus Gastranaerophilales bacterium]|nr:hypothetical protein [Candidatus Gastranaerophilales bacterium]
MKKIECLRKFQSFPFSCSLFLMFFFIYLFIGIYLVSFNPLIEQVRWNLVFNFDNGDRFYYMYKVLIPTEVDAHPILGILIPLTSLLKGFVISSSLCVNILQAICASFSVCLFNKILRKLFSDNKILILLFTLLFAFAFCVLITSAIPEVYIFVGLIHILFLYYVIELLFDKNQNEIDIRSALVLSILMLFSFAINLANILFSLVFVLYLLFAKYKKDYKSIIKIFLKIFAIFSLMVAILVPLQTKAYNIKSSFAPVVEHIKGTKEHRCLEYFNKLKNIDRFNYLIKGAFIQSIYSMKSEPTKKVSKCYLRGGSGVIKTKKWDFSEKQKVTRYLPFLFFLILPLFWVFKNKKDEFFRITFPLLCINIFVYALCSYFYGVVYSFIYTQNCFCCFMLFLAFLYKFVPKKILITTCSVFLAYQLFINFSTIYKIKQFIAKNSSYNIFDVILYSIAIFFACVFVFYIFKKFFNKEFSKLTLTNKYLILFGAYIIYSIFYQMFLIMSKNCI